EPREQLARPRLVLLGRRLDGLQRGGRQGRPDVAARPVPPEQRPAADRNARPAGQVGKVPPHDEPRRVGGVGQAAQVLGRPPAQPGGSPPAPRAVLRPRRAGQPPRRGDGRAAHHIVQRPGTAGRAPEEGEPAQVPEQVHSGIPGHHGVRRGQHRGAGGDTVRDEGGREGQLRLQVPQAGEQRLPRELHSVPPGLRDLRHGRGGRRRELLGQGQQAAPQGIPGAAQDGERGRLQRAGEPVRVREQLRLEQGERRVRPERAGAERDLRALRARRGDQAQGQVAEVACGGAIDWSQQLFYTYTSSGFVPRSQCRHAFFVCSVLLSEDHYWVCLLRQNYPQSLKIHAFGLRKRLSGQLILAMVPNNTTPAYCGMSSLCSQATLLFRS
ncbi:hypothetical protein THAOC_11296, partial [Thalassiosira oceanica]